MDYSLGAEYQHHLKMQSALQSTEMSQDYENTGMLPAYSTSQEMYTAQRVLPAELSAGPTSDNNDSTERYAAHHSVLTPQALQYMNPRQILRSSPYNADVPATQNLQMVSTNLHEYGFCAGRKMYHDHPMLRERPYRPHPILRESVSSVGSFTTADAMIHSSNVSSMDLISSSRSTSFSTNASHAMPVENQTTHMIFDHGMIYEDPEEIVGPFNGEFDNIRKSSIVSSQHDLCPLTLNEDAMVPFQWPQKYSPEPNTL